MGWVNGGLSAQTVLGRRESQRVAERRSARACLGLVFKGVHDGDEVCGVTLCLAANCAIRVRRDHGIFVSNVRRSSLPMRPDNPSTP